MIIVKFSTRLDVVHNIVREIFPLEQFADKFSRKTNNEGDKLQ